MNTHPLTVDIHQDRGGPKQALLEVRELKNTSPCAAPAFRPSLSLCTRWTA